MGNPVLANERVLQSKSRVAFERSDIQKKTYRARRKSQVAPSTSTSAPSISILKKTKGSGRCSSNRMCLASVVTGRCCSIRSNRPEFPGVDKSHQFQTGRWKRHWAVISELRWGQRLASRILDISRSDSRVGPTELPDGDMLVKILTCGAGVLRWPA